MNDARDRTHIATYFADTHRVLQMLPQEKILALRDALMEAYVHGRQVFVMGNGGSAATASHIACDLNKGVCLHLEKRFRVMCLNDNIATVMAYANDVSYEDVFVQQLRNFLCPGDLVMAFSGSGNSRNVVKAVTYANDHDAGTFGLVGFDGGILAKRCRQCLHVPIHDMQKSEDAHLIVCHLTMQLLCHDLRPDTLPTA